MNDTGGSFDSNFDDFMLEDDDTIDDFKIDLFIFRIQSFN